MPEATDPIFAVLRTMGSDSEENRDWYVEARNFLRELPGGMEEWEEPDFLVADSDRCLEKVFAHMGLSKELEERGLVGRFSECRGRVG